MTQEWEKTYTNKRHGIAYDIKEVIRYRDLISLLVNRDFKTMYKQTILGPLWIIIVPLLTTLMQVFVFGNIAGISTDGTPSFLFYLAGNAVWLYFAGCLTKTADTFIGNASIFGKVYFPRLVVPISITISELLSFAVQFFIFLSVDLYYISIGQSEITAAALLFPILLLMLASLSLGCGIIISSLTTKYRDLRVLFNFGVQLWMYASAIIFPVSSIPSNLYGLVMLNPVVPIVEAFRFGFTGHGTISVHYLMISFCTIIVILIIGIYLFGRVERTFMDTI